MLGDGSLREILATAIVVLLVYLAILVFRLARLRNSAARDTGAPGAGDATAPASAAVTLPDDAVPASTVDVPAAAPSPPRFELPKLSPVHEEAAALAREGLDIASIARRCGISEGEAELVCWLAKQRDPT
jgi:hypothetical protein